MRLLLVEDDERGGLYLERGLGESGHVVDRATDGETGLAMAMEGIYDVVVADRRLPALNGLDLVRLMRAGGRDTPVLMLSALAGMRDRVDGIQAGCDDYLAKPYAFAELLARVEALARRARRGGEPVLVVGDLRFDVSSRGATRGGQEVALQRREALLLEKLMRHAGQVVTRAMLLEAAWNYEAEPLGNVIDRHVYRLRQKIDGERADKLIHTIRGAGYMIRGGGPAGR